MVIGPDWLGATDPEGRRRLDDPEDHVRSEVRSALASPNPVVPVLVGDASLPTEDQLPDDLKALARRQAVELRDETWSEDVEMLVRRLEGKETVGKSRRWMWPVIGLVLLGGVGAAIWLAQTPADDELTDVRSAGRDMDHDRRGTRTQRTSNNWPATGHSATRW